MGSTPRQRVRNIGIIAHIDAGKTTTTERFLYYAGISHKIGEVHDGEAVMDFRSDERERGITISDAAITLSWEPYQINLIDTPGHVDFTAEVERALRVLDGAVVVFDAVEGVEPQSETVWHQADRYAVPRLAFVNKMDRVGADFHAAVNSIAERLGATPIPIQMPVGEAETFTGIVDLVEQRYLTFEAASLGKSIVPQPIPERLAREAARRRDRMIELLAERHDPLAEPYLEGGTIAAEALHAAVRAVTLARSGVPVLCGAALKNVGVQPVLDAVGRYLPSPLDVPSVRGTVPGTGEEAERPPSIDAPFAALLFKIVAGQAADRCFLRVYSGALDAGGRVVNSRTGKGLRLRRMLRLRADRGEPVDRAEAGDIVAVAGLPDAITGDTLCDPNAPILLEPIRFPETVVSIAIEPKTNADRDRLSEMLARFQREDPTLVCKLDEETGQTLLSGMGELHLEVVLRRMEREFNLAVHSGPPRVSYRETILQPARAAAEFRRTLGDEPLYARVELAIERSKPAGKPSVVESDLAPGVLPDGYVPQILDSLRSAAEGGGAFGYTVTGTRIVLTDAAFDDSAQPELALNSAASLAFREVLKEAGSAVLEPYGRLEVRVPEEFLGGVVKALNQRRAVIEDTRYQSHAVLIWGVVPISEMFGYLTILRSQSQGRGSFSLEPLDFRAVPENLATQHHERVF